MAKAPIRLPVLAPFSLPASILTGAALATLAGAVLYAFPSLLDQSMRLAFYLAIVAASLLGEAMAGYVAAVVSTALLVVFERASFHGHVATGFSGPVPTALFLGIGVLFVYSRSRLRDLSLQLQARTELLQESDGVYRTLIEKAPVGMALVDPQTGQMLLANAALARMLGLSTEELLGRTWESLIHPEDLAVHKRIDAETGGASSARSSWRARLQNMEGREVWASISVSLSKSVASGKPIFVASIRDVSDKVALERVAERESADRARVMEARRFQALADQNLVGIAETDLDGAFIFANPRFCEITGRPLEAVIGRRGAEFCHPDDLPRMLELVSRLDQTRQGFLTDQRQLRPDGSVAHVLTAVTPLVQEDGGTSHVVLLLDISAQKRNELELQLAQKRQQMAEVAAGAGIWEWNLRTERFQWSHGMFALLGLPEGTPPSIETWLSRIHPEDRAKAAANVSLIRGSPARVSYEWRIIRPDGEMRWLLASGETTFDDDGNPSRMSGICLDVTERKKTEKDLHENERRFQALNENLEQMVAARTQELLAVSQAKSQFLASMSHELRTPLNAIIGFAQILQLSRTEPLSMRQSQSVDRILRSGELLLSLVNEVLNLSKIEAGQLELSIEAVDLGQVLSDCVQTVDQMARSRGITIHKPPAALARVRVDNTRIRQVLLNILSNAIKYGREGGKVEFDCELLEDGLIQIGISDDGPGIPVASQPDIFKPFVRAGAESSNIEGTGIGLTIAKRVIEAMRGRIGFTSDPAEGGTRFWIDLPLAESGDTPTSVPAAPSPLPALAARATILYVEDNPANVELMMRVMELQPELDMLVANDAEAGLKIAVDRLPALILMDIHLPGMSGIEALGRLRRDERTRDIPVIAVSASAVHSEVRRAMDAGFNAYITKPFQIPNLLETIATHLARSGLDRPQA
ncbi:MAG: hypothetical protein RLZZ200_2566 [Pseudomonadota bacterium]|jgi:PAS domain S-box-containing protein